MALANSNFVVLGSVVTADTPNAQQLAVGTGLSLTPLGAGSTVTIGVTGSLATLQGSLATPGFPSFNISTGNYTRRTIAGGGGIAVSNGEGQLGNPTISQVAGSTVQLITVAEGSGAPTVLGNYKKISLVGDGGVAVTLTDEDSGAYALYTISSAGGATPVQSIDLSSATGIIVDPTGVQTGDVVLTVNLPGSGVSAAVQEGDLLVGGAAGYAALGVAGATTGDIVTYNGTTLVLSPPGASDVESVELASTTGIIIDPTGVQDGAVEINVNLPGSGVSAAVVEGDLLYGILGGGAYAVLASGAASVGDVLTLNASKLPVWSTTTETAWYTVSNPAGVTGSDVNMGAHSWNNVASLQCAGNAGITPPAAGFGTFWVGTDANNAPRFSSDSLSALNIVTSDPTNYGVANTVLIGDGLSYTPLAAPLVAGTVLHWDGANIAWAPNTITPLPSGLATLESATTNNASPIGYAQPGDIPNPCWYLNIADPNVTAATQVLLSFMTPNMTGTTTTAPDAVPPLYYSVVTADFTDIAGNAWTKGYVIITGFNGVVPPVVSYQVISY